MKYIVTINNDRYEVEVERGKINIAGSNETAIGTVQQVGGAKLEHPSTMTQPIIQTNGVGEPLKAPMPGSILDIKITQGARVKSGDVLFILEAMKMENDITANKDGVVTQILVTKGASVSTNDVLAVIE